MDKTLPEIIVQLDPSKLGRVAPGTFEAVVLDSATRAARQTINREFREVTGVRTLTTSAGDVLIALWRDPQGTSLERGIWLWDSQFSTEFVFQLNPALLEASALTRYLEGLLVWDKDPVMLKSVLLSFAATPPGAAPWIFGNGKHIEQERGAFRWRLIATTSANSAYVAITMSKPLFAGMYAPEALVAERFPPLRSRIGAFSREALLAELGKGFVITRVAFYPEWRDKVILAELLSRGTPSDAEVYRIILGEYDQPEWRAAFVVNAKLLAFLDVVARRRELPLYAPVLERFCMTLRPAGGFQANALTNLFVAMGKSRTDFSRPALAFIERNQFVGPSLGYLRNHVTNDDVLRRLMLVAVAPEFEKERQETIARMQKRMNPGKP